MTLVYDFTRGRLTEISIMICQSLRCRLRLLYLPVGMRHLSTRVYILDLICRGHKVEGNQNTLDYHRFHGFWENNVTVRINQNCIVTSHKNICNLLLSFPPYIFYMWQPSLTIPEQRLDGLWSEDLMRWLWKERERQLTELLPQCVWSEAYTWTLSNKFLHVHV